MKYKHRIIPFEVSDASKLMAEVEGVLNNLGDEGWELVTVVPIVVNGNTGKGLAYCKSAISEKLDI
jgi:hypothetical protein